MIAAIEVYNKPSFLYRDECFVILLLNAWELLSKAILSKNGRSIYYPKKHNDPYRTLALAHAIEKCREFFPKSVSHLGVSENIRLLSTYRDNAIHFYNKPGFGTLVYSLSQTSIVSYTDILGIIFNIDLSKKISIQILPLGLKPPIDPITYIKKPTSEKGKVTSAVAQFIAEMNKSLRTLEEQGEDTGRLLTIYNIKLESTKKIEKADLIVGIGVEQPDEGPLIIDRRVDPNISHPLNQKHVTQQVGYLQAIPFTPYVNQAIVWEYKIRGNIRYCWRSDDGTLTKYSRDYLTFLKSLNVEDISNALKNYKNFQKVQSYSKQE